LVARLVSDEGRCSVCPVAEISLKVLKGHIGTVSEETLAQGREKGYPGRVIRPSQPAQEACSTECGSRQRNPGVDKKKRKAVRSRAEKAPRTGQAAEVREPISQGPQRGGRCEGFACPVTLASVGPAVQQAASASARSSMRRSTPPLFLTTAELTKASLARPIEPPPVSAQ
jgi:hypothetical protein